MVFHSASETETSPNNSMASSTVKSQPLHNFSLPDLKWAMNNTNNQRVRKPADSTNKSPQRDADSDSENRRANPTPEGVKVGFSVPSSDLKIEKSEKRMRNSEVSGLTLEKKSLASDGRSKIFIRFRTKNTKTADDVADAGDQTLIAEDTEEPVPKTWNLRPRRAISKGSNANGGALKIGGAVVQEIKPHAPSRSELTRSRNVMEAKVPEKKMKKQKFSIALTKEEIEQDIFALTQSKPSRRPKKRAKNVQKQLDNVFPGMWLASITPESYKVPDTPTKG